MSRVPVVLLVVAVLASGAPITAGDPTPTAGEIVAVYPNPVADGDAGEYVELSLPPGTNLTGWTLADDDATAGLPNVTASGRIAVSTEPARARNHTDAPVYGLDGHLALANSGETLTVSDGDGVRDRISYSDAPDGEIGRVENGTVSWELPGKTDFPVRSGGPGEVRTFALPDAGGLATDVLASADDRILLAGYTFTSRETTDAMLDAQARGVEVRVLLEGGPVGGMTARQATLLDRLTESGVSVAIVDGQFAPVDHHHAKYAVVDSRAIVLTENWKPAGTGGASSRGWGVLLTQHELVGDLAATFRADADGRAAVPWKQFRAGRNFSEGQPSSGSFEQRYPPQTHRAGEAALLVAPDNAESEVIDRLDAAEESIHVVQVGVGGANQSFVRALKRAAERGVEVKLLLSRAWYTAEENYRVAETLERWADRHDASLSVRLARPRDRFGKIHAKGAIIDNETVLLGSLNWNDHSARENREVVLAIEGGGPSGYYDRVFRGDWRAAVWRLTVGLAVVVFAGSAAAVFVGRGIRFDSRRRSGALDCGDSPDVDTVETEW